MKTDEDLREARTAEARARQAIVKLAAEIRPILAEDFVEFPAYEVRRRFVSAPGFAARMSDDDIARLKTMLAERSAQVRDAVVAAMEDAEVWLAGAGFEGTGKSLAENPRLWSLTVPVADLVREVLAAFGFPEEAEPIEYRMPMRFIHKKYLPGLAEKYWALVADLREAVARVREAEDGRVRETLAKRWDGVK
jgi:hypothetical protein